MSLAGRYIKKIIPLRYYNSLISLKKFLCSIPYTGFSFECPCCGGHFRKFLTYGDPPRMNAQCPRCEALERHRILWPFLMNKTNLFKEQLKILHIAPEYSFQKILKSLPNLDYLSADIESSLAMIKFDLTGIPFNDNTFDVIICVSVLEFVKDGARGMKEICRVLKPGGWAILNSLMDYKLDLTKEFYSDSKLTDSVTLNNDSLARIYGRDYIDKLKEAGFVVEEIDYCSELGNKIVNRYALSSIDRIYLCVKK